MEFRPRAWMLLVVIGAVTLSQSSAFAPHSLVNAQGSKLASRRPAGVAAARPPSVRLQMAFDPEGQGKKLTRDGEPDEFFASDFESKSFGEKLKDPLVILGLTSIFLPFILLLFFLGTGVIDF